MTRTPTSSDAPNSTTSGHRRFLGAAIVAACLIGAATVVSASIPGPDGTISGCVNDVTGVVRIVDETKSGALGRCISTGVLRETSVHWNEAGVSGATGPAGATGPTGPPGAQGPPGPAGAAGAPGPAGAGEVVVGAPAGATAAPGGSAFVEALCPAGATAIGREYRTVSGFGVDVTTLSDVRNLAGTGWALTFRNDDQLDFADVVILAICLDMSP
jgi:hypothetical protein